MLRKLGLLFAALALFSIAGGHWAALQTVAWAGMLRDYTQKTGSFAVAVEQTFDGQHPCELCLKIDVAKRRQAKAESQRSKSSPAQEQFAKAHKDAKALPLDAPPVASLAATGEAPRIASPDAQATRRAEQPPTPPPRRGRA